jgi:hypothetical protein
VAVDLLQLFHQWIPYGVTQVLVAGPNAIVPFVELPGLVGYSITLTSFVALKKPLKAALPTIALSSESAPATVTVTSVTSGATILYSIDGTYPTTEYTEPVAIASACTFRALAGKTGLQQSDIAQSKIT